MKRGAVLSLQQRSIVIQFAWEQEVVRFWLVYRNVYIREHYCAFVISLCMFAMNVERLG